MCKPIQRIIYIELNLIKIHKSKKVLKMFSQQFSVQTIKHSTVQKSKNVPKGICVTLQIKNVPDPPQASYYRRYEQHVVPGSIPSSYAGITSAHQGLTGEITTQLFSTIRILRIELNSCVRIFALSVTSSGSTALSPMSSLEGVQSPCRLTKGSSQVHPLSAVHRVSFSSTGTRV